MSGSIAALFQRLTQGVYVVGVAHGEVRCFHRRLGDAGVFRSLAAGLEHQSAPFVLWAGRSASMC
jgi:hypothetical protein